MTELASIVISPEAPPAAPNFRQAGLAALFSRSIVIIAGFANSLLLPLVLDQRAIGQYFLSQLIIAGLATFCQLGFTYYVPSQVTAAVARNDLGRARDLTITVLCLSAALGALVVIATSIAGPWLVKFLDPGERSTWMTVLPVVAGIGSVAALISVIIELLRAVHAIRAAANITAVASIFAAGYAGVVLATGGRATLIGALSAILVGSFVSVALGLVLFSMRSASW